MHSGRFAFAVGEASFYASRETLCCAVSQRISVPRLTNGSSGLRGLASFDRRRESMMWINQLRLLAAHPLAAQPHR
jgi:hypothetical protein